MRPSAAVPVPGSSNHAREAHKIFSVELCVTSVFYRGRNAHYCVPPAQIPASGIPAPGSHLGCLTAKRWFGQG